MKYLAVIALLGFVAIAVFGFAGFVTHDSAFMHCAKALSGHAATCPNEIDMGLLHVHIYQGFSLSLLASVLILLFAAAGVLLGTARQFKLPQLQFVTENFQTSNSFTQLTL